MATKTKKESPMCPRLNSDQKLELRSLQLAESNLTNGINTAQQKIQQIQQGFYNKVTEFAKILNADLTKVEFNKYELKFQLRPGVKGKR